MKDKKISSLLSLLFPGLGHFYIGKYFDGIILFWGAGFIWLVLYIRSSYLLTFDNPKSFLVFGALLVVYAIAVVDSYRKTK